MNMQNFILRCLSQDISARGVTCNGMRASLIQTKDRHGIFNKPYCKIPIVHGVIVNYHTADTEWPRWKWLLLSYVSGEVFININNLRAINTEIRRKISRTIQEMTERIQLVQGVEYRRIHKLMFYKHQFLSDSDSGSAGSPAYDLNNFVHAAQQENDEFDNLLFNT